MGSPESEPLRGFPHVLPYPLEIVLPQHRSGGASDVRSELWLLRFEIVRFRSMGRLVGAPPMEGIDLAAVVLAELYEGPTYYMGPVPGVCHDLLFVDYGSEGRGRLSDFVRLAPAGLPGIGDVLIFEECLLLGLLAVGLRPGLELKSLPARAQVVEVEGSESEAESWTVELTLGDPDLGCTVMIDRAGVVTPAAPDMTLSQIQELLDLHYLRSGEASGES